MPERYLAATLAGRCSNGYERDQGTRVHAVPHSETLERNGYCTTPAACGAKPGARSAGWSARIDSPATCPRCLAAMKARAKKYGLRQLVNGADGVTVARQQGVPPSETDEGAHP